MSVLLSSVLARSGSGGLVLDTPVAMLVGRPCAQPAA